MDPDATWRQLLTAIEASDWEAASELAENLSAWLGKDGFPPQVFREHRLSQDWNRCVSRFVCALALAEPRWRPASMSDNP